MTVVSADAAPPAATQPQTPPARKRRRRAPTTGATEDCHTCRKRGASCDRRRPYCSQCLEIGKECSGYRTILTWGVGVASRGKLRGKSLPVLNVVGAQPAQNQNAVPTPTSAKASHSPPAQYSNQQQQQRQHHQHGAQRQQQQSSATVRNGDSEGPRKRMRADSHGMSGSRDAQAMSGTLPSPPPSIPDVEHRTDHREWIAPQQLPPRRLTHDAFIHPPPPLPPQYVPRRHDSMHPLQNSYKFEDHTMQHQMQPVRPDMMPPGPPFHDRYFDPHSEQYPRTPDSAPHFIDPFLSQYSNHDNGHGPRQLHSRFQAEQVNGQDAHNHPQQAPWGPHHLQHLQHQPPAAATMPPSQMPPPSSWMKQEAVFTTRAEDSPSWHSIAIVEPSVHGMQPLQHSPPLSFNESPVSEFPDLDDHDAVDAEYSTADGAALIPYGSNLSFNINPIELNIPPRMRELLDYYDKAICPVLVAFDGVSNPYRQHILPLALQNPGLQNALAALATNNIRMRSVKDIPSLKNEPESTFEKLAASTGKPTDEEQYYKRVSIQSLNEQLANPAKARDDSVLATLLILCLFHVCDSGFSKFKTQLAGVQKLLKLRGGNEKMSEFVGWVEMFFAWFDVMTSAVNDRELQVHGESLDLMDLSKNLGRLEQFSGCDGRLFKLIARLGRLNLLSQGRPVRGINGAMSQKPFRANAKVRDFYSMDFDDIDEAQTQIKEESPAPDGRYEFWSEWREIRQRLQELDLSRQSPGPGGEEPLPAPQQDLLHISESFRYSALLYTERLAHPSSPSSSQRFQELVGKSMHHIQEIGRNSCVLKFMLWPLFITGTESVREVDRDSIRDMCIDIQKESGFYNNVSGLELLERVWKEADAADGRPADCAGQAFAWRKAMDRVDGEYIVI